MTQRNILVQSLKDLLDGGNAHVSLEDAVDGLPFEKVGIRPDGLPYSAWELLWHIRIAQWDILEFSKSDQHQSPSWPSGYWPDEQAPADKAAWDKCLKEIKDDRAAFVALLEDASNDLFEPFAYGSGQTLLREALVLADHNSYHTGEIIAVRRLLGVWNN